MAQESYFKEQQDYIDAMKKAITKAEELKGSTGYVAAGFGGDCYYCYVGFGKGYNGSCFFPASVDAVVFDTEKDAQDHCYTGFRNGNGKGDLLDLHPVKASEFFAQRADELQKSLDWALDMWKNNVGRM